MSKQKLPPNRSNVATEQRHPRSHNLHRMSVEQLVYLMVEDHNSVSEALSHGIPELTKFIEALVPRFRAGGRLIYVGAGTSGRLAVLDAAELPPTFHLEPDRVIGLIAGGDAALRVSSEGLEDNEEAAAKEIERLNLGPNDAVLGISAGGTTPYVHGALSAALQAAPKCLRAIISCSPIPPPHSCHHFILLPTEAEIVTGSTRLKAGTATKIALNIISTALMIQTGHVYDNLMVDVAATNAKLRDRAARIVSALSGLPRAEAFEILDQASGQVKTALVMTFCNKTADEAHAALKQSGGDLAPLLDSIQTAKSDAEPVPLTLQETLSVDLPYVVCIDGGATKTEMLVIDRTGRRIEVSNYRGREESVLRAGPMNIHEVGVVGVEHVLRELLQDVRIAETRELLTDVAVIVAGSAGCEREKENATVRGVFQDLGYGASQIFLRGDGDLLLEAPADPSLVLIAGTGSHCIGRSGSQRARAGGLGRVLGDEGSGYSIGLGAIKSAFAERYGWGEKTELTEEVRKYFDVSDLEHLMHPINSGKISKAQIAGVAPAVQLASIHGDQVAWNLITEAAEALAAIVGHVLRQLDLVEAPVHLVGGVFKNASRSNILPQMHQICHAAGLQPQWVDITDQNPAEWAVLQTLKQMSVQ